MRDGKQALPPGWQKRILAVALAALTGNLLVRVTPWPESLLSSYEEAMEPALSRGAGFSRMTLVLAPALEERAFRLVLYGWLRRFMALFPAAVTSSLAFGMYHGNWIQGTYVFFLGMVLAWGCEGSECRRYPMAVLMHGVVNLTVLTAFGQILITRR